jgi:hypothetical protein
MAKKNKSFMDKADNYFGSQKKEIAYFFFGVGVVLFLLNLNAIIQIWPYVEQFRLYFHINPLTTHFVSLASSLVLIIYALYEVNILSK